MTKAKLYFHDIMQILGVRFALSAVSTETKEQDNGVFEQISSLFTWSQDEAVDLTLSLSLGSRQGDKCSVLSAQFLPSLDCPAHNLGKSLYQFLIERRMKREHMTPSWKGNVLIPINPCSKKSKKNEGEEGSVF